MNLFFSNCLKIFFTPLRFLKLLIYKYLIIIAYKYFFTPLKFLKLLIYKYLIILVNYLNNNLSYMEEAHRSK